MARPVPETTYSHWSAPPWRLSLPPSCPPGAMTICAACERSLPIDTRKPFPNSRLSASLPPCSECSCTTRPSLGRRPLRSPGRPPGGFFPQSKLLHERRGDDLGHLLGALVGEMHAIVDVAEAPSPRARQVDQRDRLAARHLPGDGIEIVEQARSIACARAAACQLLAIDEGGATLRLRRRLDMDLGHQHRRNTPGGCDPYEGPERALEVARHLRAPILRRACRCRRLRGADAQQLAHRLDA